VVEATISFSLAIFLSRFANIPNPKWVVP